MILPVARTPDPMDAPPLRWGIIGPGWIAERFARALGASTRQVVTAVGSRRLERSQEFAARLAVPQAHGSYEALVADPEVDVAYVARPHNAHHACALLSIDADKHTLVEKPLALDAVQGGEIAAAARERGVFCMEAPWTFRPGAARALAAPVHTSPSAIPKRERRGVKSRPPRSSIGSIVAGAGKRCRFSLAAAMCDAKARSRAGLRMKLFAVAVVAVVLTSRIVVPVAH